MKEPKWVKTWYGWLLVWPDGIITMICKEPDKDCRAAWMHIDY